MKARIEYENYIKTANYICSYNDFIKDQNVDDKVREWQQAYFALLSWKNTWEIPLEMDMRSTHNHIPYVDITVELDDAEKVESILEEYGYGFEKIEGTSVILEVDWGDELYQTVKVNLY